MVTASVIIRTFNEEKHIGTLLQRVFAQKTDFEFEVVMVDSGSTDRTRDIASDYDVRITQINPSDFTFGYSLNTGIELALGKVCLIISAHCYPCDDDWMSNMVTPFLEDQSVAIAYGRQTGTDTTFYSEQQIFNQWFPVEESDDSNLAFCNNANSAIRRSLWETYKFDETLTGLEDLDWAKHVKKQGKHIKYVPNAPVFHIHEETSKQTFTRYYREALAYRQIYPNEYFGLFDFMRFYLTNVISDIQHSIEDGVFVNNFFSILRFRFLQFWGTYKAHQYKISIHGPMKKRLYYPLKKPKKKQEERKINFNRSEIIDITRPLSENTPVWPGVPPFNLIPQKKLDDHGVEDSSIEMNLHCGTHVDSPSHFIKEGKTIDDLPVEKLIGNSFVIGYEKSSPIEVDFFKRSKIPEHIKKILIKTQNSNHKTGEFSKDYVAITQESAKWLSDKGVELVGIDGPSIQLYHDTDNGTHEVLLNNEVVILEGLDLSKAESDSVYHLTVLPLKIHKAEAAPARAVLTRRS